MINLSVIINPATNAWTNGPNALVGVLTLGVLSSS